MVIVGQDNSNIEMPALNPMLFRQRFQHITEQVFEKLDKKSLRYCREVTKAWQNCIDDCNILWKKIVDEYGVNTAFCLACRNGNEKMAYMLVTELSRFYVDLNHKYSSSHLFFS